MRPGLTLSGPGSHNVGRSALVSAAPTRVITSRQIDELLESLGLEPDDDSREITRAWLSKNS